MYQFLLEQLLNPEYANFYDPYDGLDADVSVVTKAGAKSEYSAPKLVFKRKESRLAQDQEQLNQIMSNITPLSEVFKPSTTAELEADLQEFLTIDENDTGEVVKGGSDKPTATSDEDETPLQDLDAAFKKAMADD